ncbi:hypothetical protein EXU57_14175 [Segetibacter sp. 3557_3]|uniref:hypothetical protein n=1 Tax=Segetibacter sp. 3557_3 TaxID=2547429 RepID=UPI0010589E6D|nr:hypothetical protein [Segetibacter sp. 3557_3]TDH25247.1 hypothetical protein EXU57_14175 [Segetibacter sp. 3557_3]
MFETLSQPGGIQINMNFEREEPGTVRKPAGGMPWVSVAANAPYFITEDGANWTPIGQNDAITWPDLEGIFRNKDMATVESYLKLLVDHGVTCLRLMLEYCHGESRYFEKPVGRFQPNMIRLWDDMFALCEKYGLRILLTPYDTFWMWLRWSKHPYKKVNGGPCGKRSQWLLCAETRKVIKQRLAFATERWGSSGALFAWDLWNEIHPAHAGDSIDTFSEFIDDIGSFLREEEVRLHGRAHPQTVSLFGPVLRTHPGVADSVFRHPALDFASIHFYESGTIDHPRNTVDAAISTGRLTREAILHTTAGRPFFDSEHGPIHTYKDHHKTLPQPFDDEYFRHMQWAHFASGGAGGGMRWPNRKPHSLTLGMRKAQLALNRFLPLINWKQFERRNLNEEIKVSIQGLAAFGCADDQQAILWLLRTDNLDKNGMLRHDVEPVQGCVHIPGLSYGHYQVTAWDTAGGHVIRTFEVQHETGEHLCIAIPPLVTDIAFAISANAGKI